tara:strand:+ start:7022 stop:7798 length:777 start_codon:yes stop_codon:yes gene_type:complete
MKSIKEKMLLPLLLVAVMSFGQNSIDDETGKTNSKFTLGVFGGLNIPSLSGGNDNELSRDFTSRAGGAFGFTSTLDLGSNFALRVDVLYSSEGGKRDGMQAIDASSINPQAPSGAFYYADFNNESILNYLEIPAMLKYNIPTGKSSNFYVDFGPYIGFLLNAKQKTSGSSPIYADREGTMPIAPTDQSFNDEADVTDSINSVNFGLTGGVGYAQGVGFGHIFLEVRGAYGLTVVQKETENGKSHIGNLLIALGYSIPL